MGAVALASNTIGQDRGYPIIEATLYIYCDACGSFNVKKYLLLGRLVIIAATVVAGVILILENKPWLICLLPLSFVALYLPWRDLLLRYKCRKCGNTKISDYNALHYPSYDTSILDVPEQLTQKRYIDESVLYSGKFT